ncbi:MAG: DUF3850 domain-containing protein [Verrucomicrobiota bacterium]
MNPNILTPQRGAESQDPFEAALRSALASLGVGVTTVFVAGRKVHALKTRHNHFEKVWCGDKTFECRINDRNYQRGEMVVLLEIADDGNLTGRGIVRVISHVLHGPGNGIHDGWVVFAMAEGGVK